MIKNIFKKIKDFSIKHKIISGVILILVILGLYFGYGLIFKNKNAISYTTATVEKGNLIVSVTGSGQVSASNQVDIKPKTSGDIIYVGVENSRDVKAGTLIAKIDTADAQKAVQDAQINLDQAKLDLEKMKGIETSLGEIRGIKEKATDDLVQAYEDGFNTVTNAFLNLPTIMSGLQSILFDYTLSKNSQNIDYYADSANMYNSAASQYKANAYNSYQTARTAYDKSFNDYKITNRFSSSVEIESIINETYETLKEVATAVKDTINLVQLYQDELTKHNITPNTTSTTHLSSLSGYTNTTNSYLSSLLSTKTTIETDKENLIETDYTIADQEIQVKKMQDALDEANKTLSYCYIYAPFDGVIAEISVEKSDSVSTGTSIATLITKQRIAEITLNEVDVAKVKIGQKATLTFDALPELTLTGEVSEIDTVGTVSQGVVSYAVKITLDTQNEQVKPGMSVSVAIIIEAKQDVLVVPNSAVKSPTNTLVGDKSQGNSYYVEMLDQKTTKRQSVEIGISDNTNTEIISGLQEGDKVITKTSSSSTTTKSNSTNSTRNPARGLFGD